MNFNLFLFVIAVQTEQKPRNTARKEHLATTSTPLLCYLLLSNLHTCVPRRFFLQCGLQKLLKCTGKSKVFGCHVLGLS